MRRSLPLLAALYGLLSTHANASPSNTWSHYGGDAAGTRFSAARQLTAANVSRLAPAWRYSFPSREAAVIERGSLQVTPILAEGRLYACSPYNEVVALDPGTGRALWRFDPKLDTRVRYPNDYVCRGVAVARISRSGVCAVRVYLNTADRRLIALDATTGQPCPRFGTAGVVALRPDGVPSRPGNVQTTSPPVVAGGLVVVGSSIDDNQRVEELRGAVHAFDAVTGEQRWSFDPLKDFKGKAGAANVWAPMSIDEARGLLFLPVSSASTDFYGGMRPGEAGYANSVVALKLASGEVAWSFQTTHHDVWDYDLASQPTLATITYRGRTTPAVLQPTKQGLLFSLGREDGIPIIPVVERPVPQGGAPGERLSPTQPFPVAPGPLTPSRVRPSDAFGLTFWDRGKCREVIASARAEGLYTPPSLQGTILYPFTGGGTNWGGLAFDPGRNVAYVNTSSMMHKVTLIPQHALAAARRADPDAEISSNRGAPYGIKRETLTSPFGLPCNPPPWGQLHAIDMRDGRVLWSVPLGTTQDLAPMSQFVLRRTGTPNMGGPVATAGGLVFIGAAMDNYLRAFDVRTGAQVWKGRLPAGGQATPMTYVWRGKQYVVIAAGGHARLGNRKGSDTLVAFALPR
jgi:quinoprotein glucose dehydrogenase